MDVMQFGKHKGMAMELIPMSYLLWCAAKLKKCPLVIQELDRRGVLDKYRAIKANPLTYKGTFTGSEHARLKVEFLRAGGDEDACPFDTKDYQYIGPAISWSGAVPFISPSEFPKEFI
jgi:hypothetical protein